MLSCCVLGRTCITVNTCGGTPAGRLAGPQTIEDMRQELWDSVEAVSSFGAEMEGLPEVLSGLAKIVDTLCKVGQPVEIIRKESLSALAVRAASRMLQMAYTAIVAIEPLRLPALPLPVAHGKGPAFYGATAPMLTPWLTLAMLAELQTGPMSIAFTHGQRVTSIPPMVCLRPSLSPPTIPRIPCLRSLRWALLACVKLAILFAVMMIMLQFSAFTHVVSINQRDLPLHFLVGCKKCPSISAGVAGASQ